MKKKLLLKRVTAIFCCIAMLVTTFVSTAFAATDESTVTMNVPDGVYVLDSKGKNLGKTEGDTFGSASGFRYKYTDGSIIFSALEGGTFGTISFYVGPLSEQPDIFSDDDFLCVAEIVGVRDISDTTANKNGIPAGTYQKISVTVEDTGDYTVTLTPAKKKYNVTFPSDDLNYTVTVDGVYVSGQTIEREESSDVTFKVEPKNDNKVYTVTANGQRLTPEVGTTDTYKLSGLNANTVINVSVSDKTYTVTGPNSGVGFTYTGSGNTVTYGGSYTFYITPATGYKTPVVKVNGTEVSEVSANCYVISNITEDIVITVEGVESNTYSVFLPEGDGYTATLNGSNPFNHGSQATFSVKADPGYRVTSVKAVIDGKTTILNAENGIYTVTVTGDVEIQVAVQKATYGITYNYTSGEAFTVVEGDSSAEYEASYSFYVTPGTGYNAPVVKVNGKTVSPVNGNQYTVRITETTNIEITAGGKITYTVHLTAGTGYTAVMNGGNEVAYGDDASFTVNAANGYRIFSVTVTVNGKTTVLTGSGENNAIYTFEVTGEATVNVVAVKKSYNVSFNSDAGLGSAYTLNGDAGTVEHDGYFTFYVTPVAGYKAPEVTVGNNKLSPVEGSLYRVQITGETVISIKAGEKITYKVDLIEGVGFNYTEVGNTDVEHGSDFTFKIEIDSMYDATNLVVSVNGVAISGTNGVYTISGITNAKTVTVSGLQKKTFRVIFAQDKSYTLSTTDNMSVSAGEKFMFTLNIADGYEGNYVVKANNAPIYADTNGYYTVTVNEETTITVEGLTLRTFEPIIGSCENAVVNTVGSSTINYNGSYKFTVTANPGYRVTVVAVNGTPVTAVAGTYTVNNVTSAPEITVETAANVLKVTYVSTEKNHIYSKSVEYTIVNIDGINIMLDGCTIHKFAGWFDVNGEALDANALKEALKTTASTEITLNARFELSADGLVKLSQTARSISETVNSKGQYRITFETLVEIVANSDPCVSEYISVTGYGTLLSNSTNAAFTSDAVKNALLSRDTGTEIVKAALIAGTGNERIYNYCFNRNIAFDEFDDDIVLYLNAKSYNNLVAVGWMEFTIGDERFIIFSEMNTTVVSEANIVKSED